MPSSMAQVRFKHVEKVYPNGYHAVHDFDLTIEDGEFLVLVGPSGCGKSTTLRMLAGLETVTSGEIWIGDRQVTDYPPRERNIAMVFQDYALYPHMTVRENLSLSLKLRKYPKGEIQQRVEEAARILEIDHLLDRKPKELSGGQRQRVAVGRAIVRTPDVFLFDEPLSNLDPKLRTTMRVELKKLHLKLKATMVYVTHDQLEAMTLSDRIVVLHQGRIQQIGTPLEVYSQPANLFVAGFIGTPPMNFFPCLISRVDETVYLKSEIFDFPIPKEHSLFQKIERAKPRERLTMGIRPENMALSKGKPSKHQIQAVVEVMEPMAPEVFLHLKSGDRHFVLRDDSLLVPAVQPGHRVKVNVDIDHIHLFNEEGQAL